QCQSDQEAGDRGDDEDDREGETCFEGNGGNVGADAEECRLAERHLTRVADGQIQTERGHQVDAAKRQQIDIAALEKSRHDRQRREQRDERDGLRGRLHTLRSSDLPSSPSGRNRMTSRNKTSATPSLYAGET